MLSCFKCCFSSPQPIPAISISVQSASTTASLAVSTDIQTTIQDLEKKNLTPEQAHIFAVTKYGENDVVALEAVLHLFPKIQLKYTSNADPIEQIFKAAEKGCELFISKSLEYQPNLLNSSLSAGSTLTVLTTAVDAGQIGVVSQILKHADHLDTADTVNAILVARKLGHTEIIKLFGQHGIV